MGQWFIGDGENILLGVFSCSLTKYAFTLKGLLGLVRASLEVTVTKLPEVSIA